MPESQRIVGARRAPDLDRLHKYGGQAWVLTARMADLDRPDSEFVCGESEEEVLAVLRERHPAPDPALVGVAVQECQAALEAYDHAAGGRRRIERPRRIVAYPRPIYHDGCADPEQAARLEYRGPAGGADKVADLARIARDHGPFVVCDNAVNVNNTLVAHDAPLRVSEWVDADGRRRDRTCLVSYDPDDADRRRLARERRAIHTTRRRRIKRAHEVLDRRQDDARLALGGEVVEAVKGLVARRLRTGADRRLRVPTIRYEGYPALLEAVASHERLVGRRRYRRVEAFVELVRHWAAWPADVPRPSLDAGVAEFLDAEAAALRRPRKPKAARSAAGATANVHGA